LRGKTNDKTFLSRRTSGNRRGDDAGAEKCGYSRPSPRWRDRRNHSTSAQLIQRSSQEAAFSRGIIVLIETLVIGIEALLHSAQVAATDEQDQETELSPALLWGMIAVGVALAIALFFLAPLFLTRYLFDPYVSTLVSNLIEGFLRIGIFVAYLKFISLIPGIKTVFAYHGAEHKVVNAYEAGIPLELEAVKKYSTAHARCGTSFLLIVLVIAIIVFALLGRPSLWLSVLSRIVLIPVIAAIGYEIVRLSAAYRRHILVRALLTPGLALQAMTTKEPNDNQIETALSALNRVIEADREENP